MNASPRSLRRAVLGATLAVAGCTLAYAPAALAEPVFSIAPATPTATGYFVLKAKPGAVVKRRVKIKNVGDQAGTVRIYAADATTGKTTGAVYLGRDRPSRAVGKWIALPVGRARLAPRESKVVAFSVRVPRRVRGGQHLGGIVADNVSVSAGKRRKKAAGSFKVDVHHLTITAVQVELPGAPTRRMSVDGLDAAGRPGFQSVLVDMANPGNQMIKPQLEVRVNDDDGKEVLSRTTKLDTVLPATRIAYPVPVLGKGLAPGTYDGTVVVRLGGKVLDRFTGSFKVTDKQVSQVFGDKARPTSPGGNVPWKLILACILGAAVAAGLVMAVRAFLRRRSEAAERAAALARQIQEDEDRRLAELERRENSASEREHAAAERSRELEVIEFELSEREGKHAEIVQASEHRLAEREAQDTARHTQLDQTHQLLAQRDDACSQRERLLEESELRLTEREGQAAARLDELAHIELRLSAREDEHDAHRVAHEAEAATRTRALEDGERRLRLREDELLQTSSRRDAEHGTAQQAIRERELRLRESEDALALRLAAPAEPRAGRTLTSRLRRRIGG